MPNLTRLHRAPFAYECHQIALPHRTLEQVILQGHGAAAISPKRVATRVVPVEKAAS